MKTEVLIKQLIALDCKFKRHGNGGHDIWLSPNNPRPISVPRHPTVKEDMAKAIIKQAKGK